MCTARRAFKFQRPDLRKRRLRCRPIVERLEAFPREVVTGCNICGSTSSVVLANEDRYGFPIRTAICTYCGLVYLVDRFTPASYGDFYHQGHYRNLVAAFKGQPPQRRMLPGRLQAAQAQYARQIGRAFSQYFELLPPNAHVLDIGGGVGLVAHEFVKRYGFAGTVLDPSREVHSAQQLGLRAIVGSVETWDGGEQFDLILLCRTIEHVFDLRASLLRIRNLLKPGGLCFCDIAEFMEVCRQDGPAQAATKIDHCFWLTQESAPAIFRSCGLEVVGCHVASGPDQIGYLLTPIASSPVRPLADAELHRQLRVYRECEADWQYNGAIPSGPIDWMRQHAYRVKQRVLQ
jgi:SAM-dependent methyltransferase